MLPVASKALPACPALTGWPVYGQSLIMLGKRVEWHMCYILLTLPGLFLVLFCFLKANVPCLKTNFSSWAFVNSISHTRKKNKQKKHFSSEENIHVLIRQPNRSFCCANKAFLWGLSSPVVNNILSGLFCQALTDRKSIWLPSSVNAAWEETLRGRFDPLRLQVAN